MRLLEGVQASATYGTRGSPPENELAWAGQLPEYRYALFRTWEPEAHVSRQVNFIMLNPSTATSEVDDPTVRKCQTLARLWGAGGVAVTNIFALRSTDPKALYQHPRPVGVWNDPAIQVIAQTSMMAVAAWGTHGRLHGRGEAVRAMLAAMDVPLYHLGLTKEGHPKHPLYLKNSTPPRPWGHS